MSGPSVEKLRELGVPEDKITAILAMSTNAKIMLGVRIILHNAHKLESDIRSDVITACLTFVEQNGKFNLLLALMEDHKKKPLDLLELIMGCNVAIEEVNKAYDRLKVFAELFKDIKG